MSLIVRHRGKILRRDGRIARGPKCCCGTGCCEGKLLPSDVLELEIIAVTNNCSMVGIKKDMLPEAGFWVTDGCVDNLCLNAFALICLDGDLRLRTHPQRCTAINGCPDETVVPPNGYPSESLVCDPLEAIFTVPLEGGIGFCECCEGSGLGGSGEVTFRITKKP